MTQRLASMPASTGAAGWNEPKSIGPSNYRCCQLEAGKPKQSWADTAATCA
jgi:hypothetical protein